MSLWSKGIERSKTGTVRTEDDKTNPIDEFFASQPDVRSYEITDIKNGVVNVDGSIHLNEADLDNGELFFKIAKLTGMPVDNYILSEKQYKKLMNYKL